MAALSEVTFVVIDLETTGCAPEHAAITEVGAVKYRGGTCEGELQTLVNPGRAIEPFVSELTGISETMVSSGPPIDAVLPSLLEFVGTAVLVGHNLRFDLAFLDRALVARGYPALTNPTIDTVALARRLLADETRNVRLSTLARHARTRRAPIHRALDDARATADLFHVLLERAGTLGLLGFDDLVALSCVGPRHTLSKLKLVSKLPREPGIFLFRDVRGQVLHVGRSTNLRAGVFRYFTDTRRRRVQNLLCQTHAIDHVVCEVSD